MIEVKPHIIEDNKIGFSAFEDDEAAGSCEILISGYCVEIVDVIAPSDKQYISELLLRASLNYAANRNAYMAKTKLDIFSDFPFERVGEYYQADIPTLLTGSCGG